MFCVIITSLFWGMIWQRLEPRFAKAMSRCVGSADARDIFEWGFDPYAGAFYDLKIERSFKPI